MTSILLSHLRRERGAQKADAEALGVDRITLYRWAKGVVPAERVCDVERVTGISRHQLRPDLFVSAAGGAVS